jgi:ferredoxin-NADP reductase
MDSELKLRVVAKRAAADRIVALDLARPDGGALPAWTPGAHIDLVLANGLVRSYSLCGSPSNANAWRIAILKEIDGRGGSAFVHDVLAVGDEIAVRGPRNNFRYDAGKSSLFVAGGVGVTPIVPMVEAAAKSGKPWRLLYLGRTRPGMALLDELSAYGDNVRIHCDAEAGILDIAGELAKASSFEAIYCCGPSGLIAAVENGLAKDQSGKLQIERFAAVAVDTSGDAPFEVELARSGRRIAVASGQSILDALEAAGIKAPSSCREGICGSCEIPVVSGRPLHRDQVLSPAEKTASRTMMICISRCLDPVLVLDL